MHHHVWATWNILQPRHLWAGRDGVLTACMPHSFTSPMIHFDSCNQFHVHMYVYKLLGAWRTVPQSRNHLQLLRISCTLSCPFSQTSTHSMKEVETGEPMQSLSSLPSPHSHAHARSEEHTSELQSPDHLVCRLL